jgi:2',3'-cyclic-nucleotide 2'-phosphodiesterase (5'-nucleotidase family)
MIRQSIRLITVALAALCLYLPHAAVTRAQQGNQAKSASSASSTRGAQTSGQTSGAPQPPEIRSKGSENLVDGSINNDPELEKLIAPYRTKVDELNKPIGTLASDIKKEGMGGGALGNFVADALRAVAEKKLNKPALLAVVNASGLRKNAIAAGDISTGDIYELLPFENALITLDLTGEQLLRFMQVTVRRRNAQSGARIVYYNNAEKKQNEIVSIKLGSPEAERNIDPAAIYTIVTIDYLVKRGGEYLVLQEGRNLRPLNISMRDAVIEYVKAQTAAGRSLRANLDGRFKSDRGKPDAEEGRQ